MDTAPRDEISSPNHGGDIFRLLFERSADAMTLFDPALGVFVDSNAASQAALGATSRDQVVNATPEALAPPFQPDGRPSKDVAHEAARIALERGSYRFEWVTHRFDGTDATLDVAITRLNQPDRVLLFTVSRDVSDRKRAEEEIRALNASLEQRIARRTAELSASEARLRTLVEHAPEAIVVFEADTGRFVDCNRNATLLYGLDRVALLKLGPWDVSPERQPDGRLSADVARDYLKRVRDGEAPVFEWMHRHASGRLVPCEIRLVALPSNGCPLVRGSVLDNSERHRRALVQQATYDIAEAALGAGDLPGFYARVHEIVKRLMPAAGFCIAFKDPADGSLRFACRRDDRVQPEAAVAADQALVERVLTGGTAVRFRQGDPAGAGSHPAASWLGVPLSGRLGIHGAMAVTEYLNADAYGDDEQQLLTFVASQVAQAVQRKQAETELRRSEEKFKMLFELSPLGVSRVDWNGGFLNVNQAFAKAVGYSVEELLGMTYWDITPPRFEQDEIAVLDAVRAHGFYGPFEKEYIHRDGRVVPIALYAVLVRTPDGEEQLWGITEDVTERRRAEQALRVSEQNFRALFEASSQGVMLQDQEHFTEVNAAAAKIFGLRLEEIIGRHPSSLSPEFQPDGEPSSTAATRHITECLRDGQCRFEWTSIRADGSPVPLDVVLTYIQIGGRPVIQAMVTDISDRKRAEIELRNALDRERELNALKSSFVSMVSHEFRTPLAIIQSSAEILADYLDQLEPEERNDHLRSITRNTRRMGGLMEEVLVLGRLDAGRMPYRPAELKLLDLCARLVEDTLFATDRHCPIRFSSSDAPAIALADEDLLRLILSNLLANAVKYSEPGSTVEFRLGRKDECAVFEIVDRGIGIPESDLPHLFQTFQRGSNVGQRPGTGLGLVIVKRCVDLHGGTIQVDSRPGAGTTVTVRLPNVFAGA
jgi:PAS domain S-box-containing protein